VLLALLLSLLPLAAQKKGSIPAQYAKWLNEDAVYLISDEERKEFVKLTTDPQRDKFIEEFWEIRNPLRGGPRNPFKEEHYNRIEYANQNFGRMSNTPGWMTDMGRTYILFGKPVSRFPMKGYGQIYPLELWFYQNNRSSPSLPNFFYVLFFIPEDIGDYRFYHPMIDGPMKLVRGSQFRTNRDVYNFFKPIGGDIAHAILSLDPAEPLDTVDYTPSMSSEMLVNKIQNFPNDSFEVKRIRELKYLRARVNSWFMVTQEKSLEISTLALADPTGQYWLDYGVFIEDQSLGRAVEGSDTLLVSATYRLLTQSGELILEDAEERAYPAFEGSGADKRFTPFVLANRLPLVPGKYKLEVTILNREASRSYKGERPIEVGAADHTSLLGPLLVPSVQQAPKPDPLLPFQYFGVQFQPGTDRHVKPGEPLRVLFQVQRPAGDDRNYEIEYVLAHAANREMRRTWSDTATPKEFHNGTLLKARTITAGGFDEGDYRFVVNVRAEGSPEVLASALVPIKLDSHATRHPLYFLSNYRSVAGSMGLTAYFRGLEAIAQKQNDKATEYLRQALDAGSQANTMASQALVQLYFKARKYDQITALYARLGTPAFQSAPEPLAQVALSYWSLGDASAARRVLDSARKLFPADALLPVVAKRIEQAPQR
jgi:GWxTD domain-containing protein